MCEIRNFSSIYFMEMRQIIYAVWIIVLLGEYAYFYGIYGGI